MRHNFTRLQIRSLHSKSHSFLLEIAGGMRWVFSVFSCEQGTPTEVETRSAYRAHFMLDTNNFHSARAALAVKESSYGLGYLMLFRVVFYLSSPEGSENCESDALRDASIINSE